MIEMRWIYDQANGGNRGLLLGSGGQMYEAVLQYRTKTVEPHGGAIRVTGWSEWRDVPTPAASFAAGESK
jgi:hypothetical protein